MKVFFQEISIATKKKIDIVDLTLKIEEIVSNSNIKNGMCIIHSLHSTASIIVNEHESGLLSDIARKIEEEFPAGAGYQHDRIDDNANAHLATVFLGSSKTFPVKDSRIVRGTWQNVFLAEVDGPRSRRVIVEVMGE